VTKNRATARYFPVLIAARLVFMPTSGRPHSPLTELPVRGERFRYNSATGSKLPVITKATFDPQRRSHSPCAFWYAAKTRSKYRIVL
jgi:hypothetical protein